MRLIYTKPLLKDLSQGSRIAFVRQFRLMTQDEVSDKLGLTGECKRRTMTRYEKGNRNPKNDRTMEIAHILNVNIASIKKCVKCKQKTLDLFTYVNSHPIVTVKSVKEALGISTGTARICVDNLVSMKILNETTHKARNRIFAYTEYLSILARND